MMRKRSSSSRLQISQVRAIIFKPIWILQENVGVPQEYKSTSYKLYYQVPDDNCSSVRRSQNVVKLRSSSGDKRAFKIRFSDPNLIKRCGGSAGLQPNGRVGGSNVTSPSKRTSSSSTCCIRKHVSITFVIPTLPTATRHRNIAVISSSSVASPSTATSEASRAATSRIAECAFVLVFRSID